MTQREAGWDIFISLAGASTGIAVVSLIVIGYRLWAFLG